MVSGSAVTLLAPGKLLLAPSSAARALPAAQPRCARCPLPPRSCVFLGWGRKAGGCRFPATGFPCSPGSVSVSRVPPAASPAPHTPPGPWGGRAQLSINKEKLKHPAACPVLGLGGGGGRAGGRARPGAAVPALGAAGGPRVPPRRDRPGAGLRAAGTDTRVRGAFKGRGPPRLRPQPPGGESRSAAEGADQWGRAAGAVLGGGRPMGGRRGAVRRPGARGMTAPGSAEPSRR